jgi:hypothetical protein
MRPEQMAWQAKKTPSFTLFRYENKNQPTNSGFTLRKHFEHCPANPNAPGKP